MDAGLVRANRRRWKLAVILFACFFALTGIQTEVKIVGFLHYFVAGATMASLLGGMVLGLWAREEDRFLHRPDPEEPPKLWT